MKTLAEQMANRERVNARLVAIGYGYGRLDAGETRIGLDAVPDFGTFYAKQDGAESWQGLKARFEEFVAERTLAMTS